MAEEVATEKTRIPVGTRMMARAEHVAIQEIRAQEAENMPAQEAQPGEEAAERPQEGREEVEEGASAVLERRAVASVEMPQEGREEVNEGPSTTLVARNLDAKVAKAIYYTTSHAGAYHQPIAVTPFGDKVELEDGSIWAVQSGDHYKTLNWLGSDLITITANHNWFSNYEFILTNQNTGVSVAVVLVLGPVYNGGHTHWVVAIDYFFDQVQLEDGSVWSIVGLDDSILKKWLVNDTVIMGINDGNWSTSNPNILINVNTLGYVRANCLY